MMKKRTLLLGMVLLSGLEAARAQDLESLLDNASEKTAKSAELQTLSALSQTVRQLLVKPSSEQNIWLRQVETKNWNKALLQYSAAFEGSSFQKSANGKAVLALLQFQAGLPVTGMETLFNIQNPKALDPELQRQWKELVPAGHFSWDLAQILWTPAWASVFGQGPGFHLMARELETAKNAKRLKELSETVPSESSAQAEIDWQLMLAYSMNDQTAEAGKILARLMKSTHAPVGEDLMNLTAGRLLFQNGYFETAIKLYEKVGKKSDYWTEAQEEIAWAYIRKGEPQNAMAVTQSLVTPAMVAQAGPESFFVHSLAQLKVCDYTGVTQSLGQFSQQFKTRTLALQNLAKEGSSPEAAQALELLKNKKFQVQELGAAAQRLPRFILRDATLARLALEQKHLEAEAKAADLLYAQSLAETGLQGAFDNLKKTTLSREQRAMAAALQRVQELAREEVSETQEILRKMHIIEAEVIQQAALSDRVAQLATATDDKKGSTAAKKGDVISFPLEKETWFDEVSNYKVDIKKACHAKR